MAADKASALAELATSPEAREAILNDLERVTILKAQLVVELKRAVGVYGQNAQLGSAEAAAVIWQFLMEIGIEPRLLAPLHDVITRAAETREYKATRPRQQACRSGCAFGCPSLSSGHCAERRSRDHRGGDQ
jgi:hypothetical protein